MSQPKSPPGLWKTPVLLAGFILAAGLAGGCASEPTTSQATPEEKTPMSETPTAPVNWWKPAAGLSWQWQLTGKLNLEQTADVWDVDLEVGQPVVDHLHGRGARVICYISVGSYENWRRDADQFPEVVLGKDYEGWSGEKWLDIRRIDLLAPIMRARLDECARKGFDAVEPDNMEIYTNHTGFPLTYQDQLEYALWLAAEAHQRGLAIGQKNAPDMVKDLVEVFDFAVTEDAFYYGWADDMSPYIALNKPVFAAEYTDMPGNFERFCKQAEKLGFNAILKNRDLDGFRQVCP